MRQMAEMTALSLSRRRLIILRYPFCGVANQQAIVIDPKEVSRQRPIGKMPMENQKPVAKNG